MIAYFPDPYPDELWYSLCARFSDRMRFGTETGVMQSLYGHRHAVATVDLPHRIGKVAGQLPPGHPCTVDAIIDRHTLLPYYSPFLRTATYRAVRGSMTDGSSSCIRVQVGVCTSRVRPPKFFRSCPLCDRENRDRFGETYWRRLFQISGVEVCPIHKVFLESSDIRLEPLPARHKYFSAQNAHLATRVHAIDMKNSSHLVLLHLAKQIEWLLTQERLNPGLDFLHKQYLALLSHNGFVTTSGSVRMNKLRSMVLERYGHKLLVLLQCPLASNYGVAWLGDLLRKPNTAVSPLRNQLLMISLGVDDLERFFYPERFKEAKKAVSQAGPWRCLNLVCVRRGDMLIKDAEQTRPDDNGRRRFVVKCPDCGFEYIVREGEENLTRAKRVVDCGPTWKKMLAQQWVDAAIPLRDIAKSLGFDPATIKRRAAELGLPFPRKGPGRVTMPVVHLAKHRNPSKSVESQRRAWADLRRKTPSVGVKELRSLSPALYVWLYRHDRKWLMENQPTRRRPRRRGPQIDWTDRDEQFACQIANIAARIRQEAGRPRRVTVTAIGKALGKQSLFESNLKKLPLTRFMIKSVVETGEDFAVRRIQAAAAKLRQTEGEFPRWKLVRAAGLHRFVEEQPKVKLALDYEVRPFTKVLFLKESADSSRRRKSQAEIAL